MGEGSRDERSSLGLGRERFGAVAVAVAVAVVVVEERWRRWVGGRKVMMIFVGDQTLLMFVVLFC